MTKTYDDPASITLLLEEKEKDLELAARIGQKLLGENERLQERIQQLELLNSQAVDQIAQLKHATCLKDTLLQMYISYEDEECIIKPSTNPQDPLNNNPPTSNSTPKVSNQQCYKLLQQRFEQLEEENTQLKQQTCQLNSAAEELEEQEDFLVEGCVDQLKEVTDYLNVMQTELAEKREDNEELQGRVYDTAAQLESVHEEAVQLLKENESLKDQLERKEMQEKELEVEIMNWRLRSSEYEGQLSETRCMLKEAEKKQKPGVIKYHYSKTSPYIPGNSLAHELEFSQRSALSSASSLNSLQALKAMECVKGIDIRNAKSPSNNNNNNFNSNNNFNNNNNNKNFNSNNNDNNFNSNNNNFNSNNNNNNLNSNNNNKNNNINRNNNITNNNSAYTDMVINEGVYDEMSVCTDDIASVTSSAFEGQEEDQGSSLLYDMRASSSISSLPPQRPHHPHQRFFSRPQSPVNDVQAAIPRAFCMPGKLKIVKPMEGSATLQQWQALATPQLGSLTTLTTPGIQIRGVNSFVNLQHEAQEYSLSDLEEDDADFPLSSSNHHPPSIRNLASSTNQVTPGGGGSGVVMKALSVAPPIGSEVSNQPTNLKTSTYSGVGVDACVLNTSLLRSTADNNAKSREFKKVIGKYCKKGIASDTSQISKPSDPCPTEAPSNGPASLVPSWLHAFSFSAKVKEYLMKSLSLPKASHQATQMQLPTHRSQAALLSRDGLVNSHINVGLNNIMYIKRNKHKTPSHFNHHNLDRLLLEAISSKSRHSNKLHSASLYVTSSSSIPPTPTTSHSSSEINSSSSHRTSYKPPFNHQHAFQPVNKQCAGDFCMNAAIFSKDIKHSGSQIYHKNYFVPSYLSRGDGDCGDTKRSQESVVVGNKDVDVKDEAKIINPIPDLLLN